MYFDKLFFIELLIDCSFIGSVNLFASKRIIVLLQYNSNYVWRLMLLVYLAIFTKSIIIRCMQTIVLTNYADRIHVPLSVSSQWHINTELIFFWIWNSFMHSYNQTIFKYLFSLNDRVWNYNLTRPKYGEEVNVCIIFLYRN